MSSKRSNRSHASHGSAKRTKKAGSRNNAEPEVFVLPPDLLQKLGINLGTVTSPNVCPAPENSAGVSVPACSSNTTVQDAPQPPVKPETPTKHTSILETAILMKKSVLLSPTFIPSGSHISGELEMSIGADNSYIEELKNNVNHNKIQVVTEDCHEGRNATLNEPYQSKVSKNVVQSDFSIQYPTDQTKANCLKETSTSQLSNAIENDHLNIDNTVIHNSNMKGAIVDDHQDEAYLSDCSNSNFSPAQNSNDCTFNSESLSPVCLQTNTNQICNSSDKVTILSSKILNHTQTKKVENISKPKMTDFIPVSVSTVISRKNSNASDTIIMVSGDPPPTNTLKNSEENTSLNKAVFDENDAAQQLIELADLLNATGENTYMESKNHAFMTAGTEANYFFEINTDESQETESQLESKDITRNEKPLDTGNNDISCSDISIDFMVTNLEHLEENEEIIQNFVNHLDLNDSRDILESIEKMGEIGNTGSVLEDLYNNKDSFIHEENVTRENNSVEIINKHSEILHTSTSKDAIPEPIQNVHNYEEVNVSQNEQIPNHLVINHNFQKSRQNINKKFCQTKLDKYFIKKQNTKDEALGAPKNSGEPKTIIAKHNVEEIAMLLCQLNASRHTTTVNSKYTSKNINDYNSKFCASTAEHPGGFKKKEYIRNTKQCLLLNDASTKIQENEKSIVSSTKTTSAPKVYSRKSYTKSQNIDLEIDLNNKSPENDNNSLKFCNCGDFGIYAYYDCNSLYEHIHFWEHRNTNCRLEDIFRIYEDYDAVSTGETYERVDWQDEVEDQIHGICWNDIGVEHPENTIIEDLHLQRSFHNIDDDTEPQKEVDVLKAAEKKADIQKLIKKEATKQKPFEGEVDIKKPIEKLDVQKSIEKGADIEKPIKKEADIKSDNVQKRVEIEATPKQCKNKAHGCDSDYDSHATQINTDNKIEYKTSEAIEITNDQQSKDIVQEYPRCEQESCSNDHGLQQDAELMSLIMVVNDTDTDIAKHVELVSLQPTEPKDDGTLKIQTTQESASVKTCDIATEKIEDNMKKTKRKSSIRRNADQSLISGNNVERDVPKNKSEKSTRISKRVSSKGCKTVDGDSKESKTNSKKVSAESLVADNYNFQKQTKISKRLSSKGCKTDGDDSKEFKTSSRRVSAESFDVDDDNFQKPTKKSKRISSKGCKTDGNDSEESKSNSKRVSAVIFGDDDNGDRKPTKKSKRVSSIVSKTEESDSKEPEKSSRRISAEGFNADDDDFRKPTKKSERISSKGSTSDEDAPLSSTQLRKRKSSHDANQTEPKKKIRSTLQAEKNLVTCGVCHQDMDEDQWIDHIAKEHEYIAWKNGEPELETNDENMVQQHLSVVCKQAGSLTCSRCGFIRKSAKAFLQHNRKCGKEKNNEAEIIDNKANTVGNEVDGEPCVKCGVCQEAVPSKDWIAHIQRTHDYMAWKDGETLDVNDETEVYDHLYAIVKEAGKLFCPKCGLVRIYVKKYLDHIKSCDVVCSDKKWSLNVSHDQDVYTCGVCAKTVVNKEWEEHKMIEHYNVAWIEGDTPVDTRNPYAIEKLLKEYLKQYRTFVCKICGLTRASCMGFYAHVLVCGKTEEEADAHKILCSLCNKKYLCIYHVQHMTWHRTAEAAKERQAIYDEQKREKQKKAFEEESSYTPGKRRAAQKAIAVIENYKTENKKCKYICDSCGFGTDTSEDLRLHSVKCSKSIKASNDLDESIEDVSLDESCSSEDFSGVDSDSDLSAELEPDITPAKRKKLHRNYEREQDNTIRSPRVSKEPKKFLLKSGEEFYNYHLSGENLFPDWRSSDCKPVPQESVCKYMDPLEKSCNVKLNGGWFTLSKFEAKKDKGCTLFVGSSIHCVSWAPPAHDSSSNYLAVACHRGMDCPRLTADQTPAYPGVIQIWDFGTFNSLPEFRFGLAHDYGTVWALDWCPSGTQDPMPDVIPDCVLRMGLLAIACSNGSAYIYSVAYPSTIVQEEKPLYKLKPLVELRFSMGVERKICQASTLRWSNQKGHSLIVVGYGDGTVAYYDLNTNSPLLKTKENDLTVIYPYHDEQLISSCVAAIDTFPSMDENSLVGAVCGGGPTGAVATRGVDTTSRLASRHACHSVLFQPLWPATMLISDSALVVRSSVTELEWTGKGRCLGGGGAAAGCWRCGRGAVHVPPLVRLLRPHPIAYELGKKTVGSLQMVDLKEQKKSKRKVKDEFATVIEPTTYEKAVQLYGIEFKQDKNLQPSLISQSRDKWSQRFPLADIVSMKFCPAAGHHNRLAIATLAGVVFVVDAS